MKNKKKFLSHSKSCGRAVYFILSAKNFLRTFHSCYLLLVVLMLHSAAVWI